MNTTRKTTISEGGKLANTNDQAAIKESKKKITTAKLIRWAGLSAMVSGILFVVMQPIHPHDVLSSVTTVRWAIVHYLGIAMCLLGLLGMAGIYARQVKETGWLGLAGYLMFSLFYALTIAYQFTEAFISPLLATQAPEFVESLLGLSSGTAGEMDLGGIATVYGLIGAFVLIGGLVFGIATLRAGILPRWAAVLFAFGGPASAIAVSLLPHQLERYAAVPIGLGLAWLGYALWSERREPASEAVPGMERTQLSQTGAD